MVLWCDDMGYTDMIDELVDIYSRMNLESEN